MVLRVAPGQGRAGEVRAGQVGAFEVRLVTSVRVQVTAVPVDAWACRPSAVGCCGSWESAEGPGCGTEVVHDREAVRSRCHFFELCVVPVNDLGEDDRRGIGGL